MPRTPEQELEMMLSPNRWPHVQFLPVKKVGAAFPTFGVLHCPVDKETPEPVIYDYNVFRSNFDPEKIKVRFDNFNSLLAAGWVVD